MKILLILFWFIWFWFAFLFSTELADAIYEKYYHRQPPEFQKRVTEWLKE